jgi:DNA helicase HerA-like ATPase
MGVIPISTDRQVGRVTSVNNYRITVLLDPAIRSQVRAYFQRTAVVTQIGSYLTFPVSPGESAVGIIVGASEDETIEPDLNKGMTLQLTRSRRIILVNLLGQLLENEHFATGVSVYPTLDTPALLPTEEELKSILEYNVSPDKVKEDVSLTVGVSPIYARQKVTVSYNDLLGRPLAIIGNTGSGKSFSVASLVEAAKEMAKQSKFIILDINGEYCSAFCKIKKLKKDLNKAYINNEQPFNLPLWIFNLSEAIAFFEASQASQVPVLERVITAVREDAVDPKPNKIVRDLVRIIDQCLDFIGSLSVYAREVDGSAVADNTAEIVAQLEHYNDVLQKSEAISIASVEIPEEIKKLDDLIAVLAAQGLKTKEDYKKLRQNKNFDDFRRLTPELAGEVNKLIEAMEPCYQSFRQAVVTKGNLRQVTADSPIKYDLKNLQRDALFHIAVSRFRGQERIQEYIATLRLRIHRQLSDRRWSVFTEDSELDFLSLISRIIGSEESNITVVDCSMLAYDVLPFFCAVFGRVLLELRAHSMAEKRTIQPFVLILEEAHNYLKPRRDNESLGLQLSRETFERIAKEGRKFGLSLIMASQRPSDVSPTVLSQCANFIVHRIQNPDDIDFFKRILPSASRDLLDQLPILAPGDGLLLGSAFNVPARVKVRKPIAEPTSETPKPWKNWQEGMPKFDISEAVKVWTQEALPKESEVTEKEHPT